MFQFYIDYDTYYKSLIAYYDTTLLVSGSLNITTA